MYPQWEELPEMAKAHLPFPKNFTKGLSTLQILLNKHRMMVDPPTEKGRSHLSTPSSVISKTRTSRRLKGPNHCNKSQQSEKDMPTGAKMVAR